MNVDAPTPERQTTRRRLALAVIAAAQRPAEESGLVAGIVSTSYRVGSALGLAEMTVGSTSRCTSPRQLRVVARPWQSPSSRGVHSPSPTTLRQIGPDR